MNCDCCRLVSEEDFEDGKGQFALEFVGGRWLCENCCNELYPDESEKELRLFFAKEDELLGFDALVRRGFD